MHFHNAHINIILLLVKLIKVVTRLFCLKIHDSILAQHEDYLSAPKYYMIVRNIPVLKKQERRYSRNILQLNVVKNTDISRRLSHKQICSVEFQLHCTRDSLCIGRHLRTASLLRYEPFVLRSISNLHISLSMKLICDDDLKCYLIQLMFAVCSTAITELIN